MIPSCCPECRGVVRRNGDAWVCLGCGHPHDDEVGANHYDVSYTIKKKGLFTGEQDAENVPIHVGDTLFNPFFGDYWKVGRRADGSFAAILTGKMAGDPPYSTPLDEVASFFKIVEENPNEKEEELRT